MAVASISEASVMRSSLESCCAGMKVCIAYLGDHLKNQNR